MSAQQNQLLPNMSDLGLNNVEMSLVQIVRYQCFSYQLDTMEGLDQALELAQQNFGMDAGTVLSAHIHSLLRILRTSNGGRFNYLSPTCESCKRKITSQEWLLIMFLRAVRAGNRDSAETTAMALCDADTAPFLIAAASKFCAVIGVDSKHAEVTQSSHSAPSYLH